MNMQSNAKRLTLFPVLICMVVLLISSKPAFCAEGPIQMLQKITNNVIAKLKANRAALRSNPNGIYSLVNTSILPYVDFAEMGRWVAGRNAWNAADSGTQAAFIKEFKVMVVRSYARSLLEYTDQSVEFLPLRGGASKDRIQVFSLIKESGKPPLHLDYRLIQAGGSWRVYDIIIEGVSLMQGYRAQFADDIRQGGVKAAVERMRRHNTGR